MNYVSKAIVAMAALIAPSGLPLAAAPADTALTLADSQDHKTFRPLENLSPPTYEIPGDGKGTSISDVVLTIQRGISPGIVVYSLDYTWYNHGEGNKPGSSNTVLIFDFLARNGNPLPGPSVTSTNFRSQCTRPAQHRHESGVLNVDYDSFVRDADRLRIRDSGITGYAGEC